MNTIFNYFDSIKFKKLNAPLTVQFEIHNACIAKCITCKYSEQHVSTNKTTHIDIIQAINNLSQHGTKAIRLTGGEPIIAPGFNDIVDCCLKNKMTTSITTTLLSKDISRLNKLKDIKIKLSLPCVEDEYSNFFQIDNSYFETVKDNLDFLKKHKKRVSVNYTIFEKNYSIKSIMKFVNFINQYKPFYVTFFPALHYDNIQNEKLQQTIVSNFLKCKPAMNFKSNAHTIKKHFKRRKQRKHILCHIQKFHAHIKRDGIVYPCCMSGGEIGQKLQKYFELGNIFTESIDTIYHRNYDKFKGVNLAENDICKECTQRYLSINNDFESFLNDTSKFAEI